MLRRTSTASAPWFRVDAADKRRCALNVMRFLLSRCDYPDREDLLLSPDEGAIVALPASPQPGAPSPGRAP